MGGEEGRVEGEIEQTNRKKSQDLDRERISTSCQHMVQNTQA